MAKRGLLTHPKTSRLARLLGTIPGVIVGLQETLWHFTGEFRRDGALTYLDIEDALDKGGWLSMFTTDQYIAAATNKERECVWLDVLPDGKFYIHGWHEHADDSVHRWLARAGKRFANGSIPNFTKLTAAEREAVKEMYAQPELPLNPGNEVTTPNPVEPSDESVSPLGPQNCPMGESKRPPGALPVPVPVPVPVPEPVPAVVPWAPSGPLTGQGQGVPPAADFVSDFFFENYYRPGGREIEEAAEQAELFIEFWSDRKWKSKGKKIDDKRLTELLHEWGKRQMDYLAKAPTKVSLSDDFWRAP